MKEIIVTLISAAAGVLIISVIFAASIINNELLNSLNEKVDSLSQEVKQLRYEMDSVNNDLLNMF